MLNHSLSGAMLLGLSVFVAGCATTSSNGIGSGQESRSTRLTRGSNDASVNVALAPKTATADGIPISDGDDQTAISLATAVSKANVELENQRPGMALADFEAMAIANNPTLAQAAAAIEQQWGAYRQSGLYPNPQVGYLNTTANQSSPRQSNGILVSQEFVTAKKLSLAQAADSQEIRRLEWDQEAQQMRVLNDVKIRFYEVLSAQRQLDVHRELERLSGEHLVAAQSLFEAQSVSRTDVLQATVLVETSRIRTAEATHRLETAWAQLATMVGVPALPMSTVRDLVADEIPDLDLETEWQRILAESPQLKAIQSELNHGCAILRLEQAQANPNVTVQFVADYDRVTHSTTASTLIAAPLPVFNRNQGNIDKAAADIRADQADIMRSQLVLREQLADSFKRFKTSRLQASKLKESIVPAVDESLKLTAIAYRSGEVSFREVLAAQETFAQSRIAHIEAIADAQKVAVEIKGMQLTGGLNPAAIGSAIQTQSGGGQRQRALLQEVQDQAAKQFLPAAQIGR